MGTMLQPTELTSQGPKFDILNPTISELSENRKATRHEPSEVLDQGEDADINSMEIFQTNRNVDINSVTMEHGQSSLPVLCADW